MVYIKLGGEVDIREGLKYLEKSLKIRQELFLGNHPDIAESLNSIAIAYQKLEDDNKALEYRKQVMSIYFALTSGSVAKAPEYYQKQNWSALKEQRKLMNAKPEEVMKIKTEIESLQPRFFVEKGLREILTSESCFGGNNIGFECRWIITSRGESKEDFITLKQKLQKRVLNDVVKTVNDNGWSNLNWHWSDEGVKGYLEKSYLSKELKTSNNNEIEMAQMLCFESMNLGIMKSEKKPYSIVQEFTRNDPELVKKIAQEHPEFFIDGSIVEACIKAMPGNATFEEYLLKHVKYMGMEARKERGFENFRKN